MVLKYYMNHSLFLFCVISSRGRQEILKCAVAAYFRFCLHISTNTFDPSEKTDVSFFE